MKIVSMLNDETLKIAFSYSPETVAQVRCLPQGRRWVPELRAWTCPVSVEAIKQLRSWGFTIESDAKKWEQDWILPAKKIVKGISNIPGLKLPLYPFQAEGVGFIEDKKGRCLIGDEMGLGKTIQALAWLQYKGSPVLPAVVICPASLKNNWAGEVIKWTSLTPYVLSGEKPQVPKCFERRDVVYIINYNILKNWVPLLNRVVKTVVLDECHFCKSSKTQRTRAVQALCKGKQNVINFNVIALSGTPITNRPIEFYNTLNIIAPNIFNRRWDYAQRYCDAKFTGFGWDLTGASNLDELNHRLKNVMIRRLKEDVLTDLPPKTQTCIPLELNGNMAIYDKTLLEVFGSWGDDDKPSAMSSIAAIGKLRQAALAAKFDSCCEWIDNFLEGGNKLVVMVVHHSTTDKLLEKYGDIAVVLDGRVPVERRQEVVERFQKDPSVRMLIGNIEVAGMGVTLTAAQDLVFLEFPWSPGLLAQAEDRIHRIGQKGNAAIYYLVAQGTLEESMIELLVRKSKVLNAVLDGIDKKDSESVFDELVTRIRNERRQKEKRK